MLDAAGRFGPGLPRVSDGSLLFLLHLLSNCDCTFVTARKSEITPYVTKHRIYA